jgi:uncharacterized protein (DUF58 family)
MVRREEQPQRARATVLLDTRRIAYRGAGPDSAFEWAVSGAASVLLHLMERGFSVRLLTDTGDAVGGEGSGGFSAGGQESAEAAGTMMDTLAVVGHSDGAGLSRAHDALRGGEEGLLVAFLGDLDDAQVELAAKLRPRTGAAVAFVLDSAAWTGEGPAGRTDAGGERLRRLRGTGWTALAALPGAPFAALWRQAGNTPAGRGTSGGWG